MQSIKLIVIMILLGNSAALAQSKTLTINSKILNEERQILVGLPDSYEFDGEDFKYPLLLLIDGEWHFDMVLEATKLLYQNGFPKVIVAGIVNNNRGKDLTPTNTPEIESSGNANKFCGFITEELIDTIEKNYRISEHRTLMGHSLGGLFATYAITQSLDSFDAIVAITPTIRWDDFRILNDFTPDFNTKLTEFNKPFFLGIGDEVGAEREGVARLNELFTAIGHSGFVYKEYLDESHVTVPWKAYFDGIKFIFKPFLLPDAYAKTDFSKTIAYYKNVGSSFDYDDRVPQRILFNRGYGALENDNMNEAKEIFEYYKKEYPNVPFSYSVLGDIHFDLKEYKLAKKHYDMAYKLYPTEHVENRIKILKEILD